MTISKPSNDHLKVLANSLGYQTSQATDIELLDNGDEIFPAMLEAIAQANHYIFFETFIYWNGDTGRAFTEALIERAKTGVKCHVLFDGFGCRSFDKQSIQTMRDAGVLVDYYNPLTWRNAFGKKGVNRRTHRKLLVVDGDVGFIGGVGIADEWAGNASSPDEWRDIHFKLHGPIIGQFQAAFFDNWLEFPGTLPDVTELKMPNFSCDGIDANLVLSTPAAKYNAMELLVEKGFQLATQSIRIISPYFIPSETLLQAMVAAVERGVTVEIVMPGKHIDKIITRHASRHLWGRALSAGIALYEYQPTFIHSKLIIIDEQWVSVGSTNMDCRSLRINEEANLNVFDQAFSAMMIEVFEKDKALAKPVSLNAWQRRPKLERLKDYFASFFRKFL